MTLIPHQRLVRFIGVITIVIFGILSTLGSGGGGGGNDGSGTAPTIDNLSYSPTGAFLNDGDGLTTVNGSIDFNDPDGDIASYEITILDSSNNIIATLSDPIPGIGGITSGTLFVILLVNTTVVDDYTVTVNITDSKNNISNTLSSLFPVSGPIQVSSNIPDTGVNKCYNQNNVINCPLSDSDAFYGQDYHYTTNSMSYTYNGDTVTDNVTSLMWQAVPDGTAYNWYEATGTIDVTYNPLPTTDVCGDLVIGIYNDWRLPEKRELQSIVDYGVANPAINTTYFTNTGSNTYWTNTEYDSTDSWYVQFSDGAVLQGDKTTDRYVHCVRGSVWGNSAFIDNGDGTATDTGSGLMWQKTGQSSGNDWQAMLDICTDLSLAGHADWRLPDIKELATTVNAETSLDVLQGIYCSASTIANDTDSAWIIQFFSGSNYGEIFQHGVGTSKSTCAAFYSRCVRSDIAP